MSEPGALITPSDKSLVVQIVTSFFLVVTVCASLARTGTKYHRGGGLKKEDHLATMATFASIGQFIAVIFQCQNGLGRHADSLNDKELSRELKSEYAANTLFVVSMVMAKLSYMVSVATLAQDTYKRVIFAIGGFVVLWASAALLAVLFQCHLPTPWNHVTNQCIDRTAFWTSFSIFNIVTEVSVIAIMLEATRQIRMPLERRLLVIQVFGTRFATIPAIVLQIYYSIIGLGSSDETFDMWLATVMMQLAQTLSILTISMPYLNPFLRSLEHGQMGVREAIASTSAGGGHGYREARDNRLGVVRRIFKSVVTQSGTSNQSTLNELTDLSRPGQDIYSISTSATATHKPPVKWDNGSRASQTGLIHEVRTWDVRIENGEPANASH